MSRPIVLTLLFVAALLETGGDALIRTALYTPNAARLAYFVFGGVVLFGYGYVVNGPPWDFGRLLGVYIVLFFVVAQLTSWLVFSQRPTTPILVGGAFVVAGGVIMTVF